MPSAGRGWLNDSGLDTSNGVEFIQTRIGLFAGIITLIGLAFLVVGIVAGQMVDLPFEFQRGRRAVAHLTALVLLAALWLVCRRGHFSVSVLGWLDAVGLVGACAA